MNYLLRLAPYAKAVSAFLALLVPFLACLVVVLTDFTNGQVDNEHLTILGTSFLALVAGTKAVHATPNVPKEQLPKA